MIAYRTISQRRPNGKDKKGEKVKQKEGISKRDPSFAINKEYFPHHGDMQWVPMEGAGDTAGDTAVEFLKCKTPSSLSSQSSW